MKRFIAVLLLAAAVLLTYAPALRNGFVWDDTALVLRDPLIRSWRLIPEGFNHFLFTDATASDFYRPLQRLVYTGAYASFAFRPAPYHLISILCHAAAAVALFFLAEALLSLFGIDLFRRRLIAVAAAMVWAIHPVHSAAVIYISGLADPLAALFGFLGLFLVVRSIETPAKQKLILLAGATLAFLLSALSKEYGLVFPLLALVLLVWRNRLADTVKLTAGIVIVATIYLSLRLPAEHIPPPVMHTPPPLLVRPIIISRAVAEYAGLAALPINLHMERDVESNPTGPSDASMSAAASRELQTLLGLVCIGLVVFWMIRAYRRNPAVFACLLLAISAYLPVSGLVTLNASVAEHWIYVPTAFLFLAGALQLTEFLRTKSKTIRFATAAILLLWVLFLGTRTFLRTFDWRNQRTFVERTIANGGDSARMLINLGSLEMNEGKLDDAAVHLHAALQKKPDQPLAVLNLAALAIKQNDFKLGRELLKKAADMPLVAAQAEEFRAVLEHKETGHIDFMRLRLASRTGASNWDIEKQYVKSLDAAGATNKAIAELQHRLQTEWYRADSWQVLAQLFAKSGQESAAKESLARAHAYDVHLPAADRNL